MAGLIKQSVVAVWLLALLLAGCTNGGTSSVRLLSTAELVCDSTITVPESARTPEGYRWILDAVAMPEPDIRHEMGRTDPETGLQFAKMGLLVRPGTAFAITVDAGQDADIRLAWGHTVDSEPPAQQFVVPGCDGDDAFLIYAGGVWLSEPACVGLTVSTGVSNESIRLPIEASCP